jgi:thiol-disulfide isomerase/thioredoxin
MTRLFGSFMGNAQPLTKQSGGGMPSLWMIIGGIILLFLVGVFVYSMVASAKKPSSTNTNNEFIGRGEGMNSDGTKDAELMLFYVDWCPHCKTAKPEWEQLKSEYEGRTVNGYNIIFTEINCTSDSPDTERLMNTYKIEGYPTIKLLKDGTVIEYDARPTKATLVQFLNTVL